MDKPVILFDSDCLLCNTLVRFLVKRDNGSFYYASLHSSYLDDCQKDYQKYRSFDSIVVLPSREVSPLIRSVAVFYIIQSMNYPWKALLFFKIVPRPLLDLTYRLIAKLRRFINIKNRTENHRATCLLDSGISKIIESKILK